MKKEYEDDDGRTVADMSNLPDASYLGAWTGKRLAEHLHTKERSLRGAKPVDLDRKERKMYVLGAMRASLLIGFIFLAVFAAAIVIMLLLFGVL